MDVWKMFEEFNKKYFEEKLNSVKVTWSPHMTLLAGKTVYRSRGRKSWCAIRLSQPLLSQRPHSDTVNTLLHEMIHAYLHITQGNKYHDSHGPEYRAHMHRINSAQGSRITLFHNFRKEVDKFRVHVYRCDGPCVSRRPFYGILRCAIPDPPGPTDKWYERHLNECGGTFHKIAGPGVNGEKNEGPGSDGGNFRGTWSSGGNRGAKIGGRGGGRWGAFGQKVQSASNQFTSNSPTPAKTQSYSDEYYQPGKVRISHYNSNQSPSKVQPQFAIKSEPSTSSGDFDERSIIEKIKSKYANTKESILLSQNETKQAYDNSIQRQGKSVPLKVCARVDGRMNYSYIPKNLKNLNIHKYLRRYKDAMNASQIRKPAQVSSTQRQGKSVPLEVCARVHGRINYSYIPKNLQNLNIHKYLRRYIEAINASQNSSQSSQISNSSQVRQGYGFTQSSSKDFSSSPSERGSLGHTLASGPGFEGSFKRKHTSIISSEVDKYMKRFQEAKKSKWRSSSAHSSHQNKNHVVENPGGVTFTPSKIGNNMKRLNDTGKPTVNPLEFCGADQKQQQSFTSPNQSYTSPSPNKPLSNTNCLSPNKLSTKCPVCGISVASVAYDQHVGECFGNEMDFDMDILDEVDLWSGTKPAGVKVEGLGEVEGRNVRSGHQGAGHNGGVSGSGGRNTGKKGAFGGGSAKGSGSQSRPTSSRDRSGPTRGGFASGGVWGEWETMACPNCGSDILVAEKDFHLQFCIDSDDDDDEEEEEDLGFYKNSYQNTPDGDVNGRKSQRKMSPGYSKGSYSKGKSRSTPSKHPQDSQDQGSEDPDFVTCPSCMERVKEKMIHEHLDQCLSFLSEEI